MAEFPENPDFQKGEVLLFNKELDWTSFDLVKKVRNHLSRAIGIRRIKIGHTGTLDPRATGLMILCTGKATKQIERVQNCEKEYIANLKLGATSPSFDLETEEDKQFETFHITREFVKEILKGFIGEINQIPPMFSAVKVDGKRAYELARKGVNVELKPKKIWISEIELLNFSRSEIQIRVVCSKGTYIRALARDVGSALNSGAYLVGLRRTRIGNFLLEDALTIDDFLKNIKKLETNLD